ncbi:hypothetical protein ES703_83909 [subsurface metagenome]
MFLAFFKSILRLFMLDLATPKLFQTRMQHPDFFHKLFLGPLVGIHQFASRASINGLLPVSESDYQAWLLTPLVAVSFALVSSPNIPSHKSYNYSDKHPQKPG